MTLKESATCCAADTLKVQISPSLLYIWTRRPGRLPNGEPRTHNHSFPATRLNSSQTFIYHPSPNRTVQHMHLFYPRYLCSRTLLRLQLFPKFVTPLPFHIIFCFYLYSVSLFLLRYFLYLWTSRIINLWTIIAFLVLFFLFELGGNDFSFPADVKLALPSFLTLRYCLRTVQVHSFRFFDRLFDSLTQYCLARKGVNLPFIFNFGLRTSTPASEFGSSPGDFGTVTPVTNTVLNSDPLAREPVRCFSIRIRNRVDCEEETKPFQHPTAGIQEDLTMEEDDKYIFCPVDSPQQNNTPLALTAYKRVDKKVHPVSGTFPIDAQVRRQIPEDPLATLTPLPECPPEFTPTQKLTQERLDMLSVNSDGFLLPEEEKLFKHIMWLNQEALPFEEKDRGTLKESYFSPYIMPTIPHTPWEYRNIPIPPGILSKVIELLKLKMEAGVYEPSQSSYRSRWFCVLKKNGSLRLVHDLQPLNKVTIRDAGQLPIVDDFVEGFAGRQCYTVFDLFWGFDARKVDPNSRDLTAFMTPLGLLRLTSLPMGYTNSPAEFQKSMAFILQEEIPDVANIFIDDLPIKGPKTQYLDLNGNPEVLIGNPGIRKFIWEHAVDVHRIMHRIKCAGATFSPKKTQICRPEVLILGQKCTPMGRLPDEDKVAKILKWQTLETPKDVRSFLGLCGTVRVWIKGYSALVRPLTELYHIGKEFVWTPRRQEAFDTMKRLVSSAPALHPIDYESDNPVILSVDSSCIAAGMILSQIDDQGKRRPARYGSIPMSERESRYSQPKLELFGLYRALRRWRLYIIGVKNLHVEVDAQYIKGMLNEPDLQPNAAVNRWIQGILLFDFKLVHVSATKFRGPDALSRRQPAADDEVISDDDSWLDDIALLTLIPDRSFFIDIYNSPSISYSPLNLPSCLATRSAQEQNLKDIQKFLQTLESPPAESTQKKRRFLTKATEFFIKNGQMFKRNGSSTPLLVIFEPEKRLSILTQAHDRLGHRAVQSVFETLRRRFFWPHLRSDVQHHAHSCHECQIRSLKRREIPITVSVPVTIFNKIYVDVMHMPEAKGFKYIVAARDDLSGTCEAQALRVATSKSLAHFFWTYIYCRYGAPLKVVTDNGSEVQGAFQRLMDRMGIPQIKISPYNHHANGVVERGHFTLREAIVKSCKGKISDWPQKVPEAVFADRVTVSRVTGFSPYQLLHATDPLLPFDLTEATFLVEGFHSGMSTSELLALRIQQLSKHENDIHKASETLRKSRFQSKAQFEKRFHKKLQKELYKAGELVLVRNNRVEMELNRKTKPRYLGPFEVVRKNKGGAYKLKELDGTMMAGNTAAYRLLPYISRNHWFMRMGQIEEDETNDDLSGSDGESSGESNSTSSYS